MPDLGMEYLYGGNENYEDFASGRVLYGGRGMTNFPVRLLKEMYGRAKSRLGAERDIVVYDPCCGGGYALTVLGFLQNGEIGRVVGSDLEESMAACAKKNTGLLTRAGLEGRRKEIEQLYQAYGKASHRDALKSCDTLETMLEREIAAEIFRADCTEPLPQILPDMIIADVPYGKLAEWAAKEDRPIDRMLDQLWLISHENTILAVSMDKTQKIKSEKWKRLEKHTVGKRKFEILRRCGGENIT